MTRPPRHRITLAFGCALLAACSNRTSASVPPVSVPAPADSPRELGEREQAVHVLNRLAFGPRPGDVDRVMSLGVDRWVAEQLEPERIRDDAGLALSRAYPTLAMDASTLMREFPRPGAAIVKARLRGDTALDAAKRRQAADAARKTRVFVGELQSFRVARAVVSERQLLEVMTDFWENHFSVYAGKGQLRYYLPEYDRQTIRPFALGKFRDLLGAVAKSPAMLVYLDNVQSVADSGRERLGEQRSAAGDRQARRRQRRERVVEERAAADTGSLLAKLRNRRPTGLNENYARELLELHTLGVDGGYTQQDVIEVARALTGWGVRPGATGGGFIFRPEVHDAEEKVVLGRALPAGRGEEDGEEVLDLLARHPSTARFIARKLAIRFVSDTPPGVLVDRATEAFRRSDGDLRETVRTIVTSPEFYARAAYRSKVKSPFEVVVSSLRALGARPDTTPRTAALVAQLGQPIFGHQAPNGWPETGEAWMNTGAILERINFGLSAAAGQVPEVSLDGWPEYAGLRDASHARQVDGVVDALLGGSATPETRDVLERGSNPLLGREGASGGRKGRRFELAGLDQIVGLALGSPEFQRR